MNIQVDRRSHVTVLAIAGSVDGATAPVLVASFREQVAAGSIRLVGDFALVEYTSSAGSGRYGDREGRAASAEATAAGRGRPT